MSGAGHSSLIAYNRKTGSSIFVTLHFVGPLCSQKGSVEYKLAVKNIDGPISEI